MRYRESKVKFGQKSYLKNDLDKIDVIFLKDDMGFLEVKERDLNGKENIYLVFQDKYESPKHIILTKEIVDYLKQFNKEIWTYRTVKPDIVFCHNDEYYAIEIETGKNMRDKNKMKNKTNLLKKNFGKNWFFFVTNRNLQKKYSKFGITATKRNIRFKIRQIFKKKMKWRFCH